MRHLFAVWPRIVKKIKSSKRILLSLDYDGTLTPIVSTPDKALLSPEIKKYLKKISKNPRVTLAVISGRTLRDVRKKVTLEEPYYAGIHGLEIKPPKGKSFVHPQALRSREDIRKIKTTLAKRLSQIKGVLIEDKILSVSLHYRGVKSARQVRQLKRIFTEITSPLVKRGRVRIISGKKVMEVRPALRWDKGEALLWMMKDVGKNALLPIHLGDDTTDEDAFSKVNKQGISIFVGKKRPSRARYYLKDVTQVKKFLSMLDSLLREDV